MHLFSDERGQFSYGLIFIVIFISLLIFFAIVFPFLSSFTVNMYSGISPIVGQAKVVAGTIQDTNISNSFTNALNAQTDNVQTNVDILSSLVQYSGIIIIIIVLLGVYLLSRRNVEAGVLG
jgi:predicted PurR-regulated permease PerM